MTERLSYLVGVTSAPRPIPTLPKTLDSLAAAGWTDPIVFYDGERHGPWWNFKRVLRSLVELGESRLSSAGQPDCILLVEDDIAITPGLRWIFDEPKHRPQFDDIYSLYSSGVCNESASIIGWNLLSSKGMNGNGALAYLMRFETAVRISLQVATVDLIKGDTRTDAQIAETCKRNGLFYFAHCPSFVRHTGTGDNTSLRQPNGDGPTRQCSQFVTRINDDGTFETADCSVDGVQERRPGRAPNDY